MPRDRRRRLALALTGAGVLLAGLVAALVAPGRATPRAPASGHETSDVSVAGVLGVSAVFVASLALLLVFSSWLQVRLTGYGVTLRPPRAEVASPAEQPSALPSPGPSTPPLTGTPSSELAALRQAEAQRLSSYGWVDHEAGIARIPIDQALDLLARRGLPSRPAAEPAPVAARAASGRFVERGSR